MSEAEYPEYLNKNVMFSRRVQIGRNECFDFVLTHGPRVYVIKGKQVLSLCDLTSTVMKESECKQSDFTDVSQGSSKSYDFDVCFSYAGKVKQIFLLLKMKDNFVVMSKRKDHLIVHKEYQNVRLFKIEEKHSVIHIRIEMLDDSSICEDLYNLTTDSPILEQKRFGGVANTIANRIVAVKAELSTTKLDVQKYFHILSKELRFGNHTLHDVRIILCSSTLVL